MEEFKNQLDNSNLWSKNNFTEEEATGYEVGAYDADNNRLYYYWMSY